MSPPPSTHPPAAPPVRWTAALRHAPDGDGLPTVVATGRGAVADRILDLAFAHGVPVREDADLARVLAAVEPGTPIPPDAVMAVAEILVHLYRLNHWLSAGETAHASEDPHRP